jgi:hypothetical protein
MKKSILTSLLLLLLPLGIQAQETVLDEDSEQIEFQTIDPEFIDPAYEQGKSALRPWLRVVLWNFLRRRPIADNTTEIIEDALATKPHTNEIELNENITFFANLVRESIQVIPKRDRLLLSMIYIDNLLKKDIAAMFQVHPGQIGRWERAAVDLFRQNLLHRLENLPNRDSYDTLVGGIANNPKEFSEALVEALKQLRNENVD